jgi:toxin YoeB
MRSIEFIPEAFSEYQHWIETDRRIALKIGDLIRDTLKTPFSGMGKPEALKHQFKGCWSRRINQEHRLIYQVTKTSIIVFSCYSHYS